jgi:Tol biopolymer transport system component
VFVRDVAAATTVLASRQPDGSPLPMGSGDPALSGDGNRVAFSTGFSMDAQDAGNADVYLRDLASGTTVLVSRRGPNGPAGNDDSSSPALDADGSHVAFGSSATDLQPTFTDANLDSDVFVRDVAAGQVQLVSRAAAGTATANDGSSIPAISADGNRIAFTSGATNLGGGGDLNGAVRDIYLRDMAAGTTDLVSRTAGVNGISGNGPSERPSIDAAGTRVAFETQASDLVPGDLNGQGDVVVRDTAAATTEIVSLGAAQANAFSGTPSLSGNGDCVIFETFADNVAANPAGTDFNRVAGRALRGDCPFGPLPEAPPPVPPLPQPPVADRTAPVLSKVRLAPRRFRAGARVRPRTRRRPPTGARLRFTLSEAATVTVRVDALLRGRRVGRRCAKPRAGKPGRACTRAVRRGTLTLAGKAGANRFAFTGRVARKRLAAGRHRATVRARDAAGNRSGAKKRTFRVLRP